MATDARLIVTSLPDDASADSLARTLVEERLAACVTRVPGRSTYRWQGAVEEASEVICLVKTTADRVEALLARLHALHPYEVPEGLVLTVDEGLPSYLAWLGAETRYLPA